MTVENGVESAVENGEERGGVLENGDASVLSNDGSGSSSACAFVLACPSPLALPR